MTGDELAKLFLYGDKGFTYDVHRMEIPTEANIRAAVERVSAQRMMALASIGDTSPAEWTDEALNAWIGLMASVRG